MGILGNFPKKAMLKKITRRNEQFEPTMTIPTILPIMSLLLPRVFYPEKKQIPFADAFSSD
jgi:hypothetical protein